MRLLELTLACLATGPLLAYAAPAQQPCVDLCTLIDNTHFYPRHPDAGGKGLLEITDFGMAFMPATDVYDPNDDSKAMRPVEVVVLQGDTERLRHPVLVEHGEAVFSFARSVTGQMRVPLDTPGSWEIRVDFAGGTIARLPFEVQLEGSGDPFDPATDSWATGSWQDLGVLIQPESGDPSKPLQMQNWMRGGAFNTTGQDESLQIEIVHEGRTLYESSQSLISADSDYTGLLRYKHSMKLKPADGGGPLLTGELLKKDGGYAAVVKRAGEVAQVFSFAVAGGKFVQHPRSAFGYSPAEDYLLFRSRAARYSKERDLLWMDAVPQARWGEYLDRGPMASAGPSADDLARWATPAAPARGTALTVTPADVRMDGAIAVGSDVIAFGTGGYNGVGWMRVGDTERRTLPGGTDFSAYGLGVAGKQIVLWRGTQLCVFDTETETLHEIPEDVVHLMKPSFKPYGPALFAVDGMLVATLNDPNEVSDRRMVKVIDLSGPEPVVIALQNPEAEGRELTGIGVDGETGALVVSSQKRKQLWYGTVEADTDLRPLDLSGADGVSEYCAPQLAGGRIIYFDDAGSKPRLRVLDPASGQLRAFGSLPKELNTFCATPELLAMTTEVARGSAYRLAFGPLAGPLEEASNTGDSGAGSGNLGMCGAVAVAPDGTLFGAGMGASGIGSDEFLQLRRDGAWHVLAGPDGGPLTAVDAVAAPGVLAFKTGSRNDTKIAYLTFGPEFDPAAVTFWSAE